MQTNKKRSCVRETQNLLTNGNRSIDTEKNKDFFFFFRGDFVLRGRAALDSTAEHWSIFLSLNYTARISQVHFA